MKKEILVLNETIKEVRTERIEEFFNSIKSEIDISYCIDPEEVESFEDVEQAIEDNNGFDIDIIYYHTAIEYLKDNDPSLQESLGIANDMGFEPKNLNSETLASLLASQNAREEFQELQTEIEDFFEKLDEDTDEINNTLDELTNEGIDDDIAEKYAVMYFLDAEQDFDTLLLNDEEVNQEERELMIEILL